MSIEELLSVSKHHFDVHYDLLKQFDFRVKVAKLDYPENLIRYLFDYYVTSFPDIPPQVIIDCIIKSFSSVEIYSVFHYLIDGYIEEYIGE